MAHLEIGQVTTASHGGLVLPLMVPCSRMSQEEAAPSRAPAAEWTLEKCLVLIGAVRPESQEKFGVQHAGGQGDTFISCPWDRN